MADHADAEPSSTSEPVLIAHAVTVVLAALVGLGWLTVPDPLIDTIGTGVFLLVSTVAAVMARGKVTPVDGTTRGLTAQDVVAYVTGVIGEEIAALEARQAAQVGAAAQRLARRG